MVCRRRNGGRCLAKIAKIAHQMGWTAAFNVVKDGKRFDVVLFDRAGNAHAFPGSGRARVFIVREARKLGLSA